MPGKRYARESLEFNNKHKLGFDISDYYDAEKKLSGLNNFLFNPNARDVKKNIYVNVLTEALSAELKGISKMEAGKRYGATDVFIGEFIDDFDRLMQAKFADEAEAEKAPNTHKPLEGSNYNEIASAVWENIKHLDKPTPDVWADSIINGDLTLEDIKSVIDPAKGRLYNVNDTWGSAEKSDYLNTYMAKQALDKAIAGRSRWWKAWPGNWREWYRESKYSNQLGEDLMNFQTDLLNQNLSSDENILSDDTIKEITERSMIASAKSKLQAFLKDKDDAKKTAPDVMIEMSNEININSKENVLDQREFEKENAIQGSKARKEEKNSKKQKADKSKKDSKSKKKAKKPESKKPEVKKPEVKKAPPIKPRNRGDLKMLCSDRALTKDVKDQFVELLANSGAMDAKKDSMANNAHMNLGFKVADAWRDPKNMHTHAIDVFKCAYKEIKDHTPNMSVVQKMVAAQKMTDIMMNIYSPVASDEKLKEFGNNYAVQKMYEFDIKELTGYEGDIDELMSDVKLELGIDKANVRFEDGIFNDKAGDKSSRIDERKHDAPNLDFKK